MMDWLKRNEWIMSDGSGFAQATSFFAFLAMPGCVFGALIQWIFLRE